MDGQRDQPVSIWVGLTDDILSPVPGGPTSAPVVLSAEDAIELLSTFQHLVYSTAMLDYGLKTTQYLRGPRRIQYDLIVTATSTGSFFFGFRTRNDVQNAGQLSQNLAATVAWAFALLDEFERLSEVALDLAPSVVPVVIDVVKPIIELHVGHPIQIDRDQATLLVAALVAWVKYGRDRNRRLSVRRHVDEPWLTVTREQTEAAMRAGGELIALPERRNEADPIDLRKFDWSKGEVTEVDPVHHDLYVQFPKYVDPLRCWYDATEGHSLGNLQKDDLIEIIGTAYHVPHDPQDAKPMTVHIKDWHLVKHKYRGFLKN